MTDLQFSTRAYRQTSRCLLWLKLHLLFTHTQGKSKSNTGVMARNCFLLLTYYRH